MGKALLLLPLLLLTACFPRESESALPATTSNVENTLDTVVAVMREDSTGHRYASCAGVVIGDRIVTAAHCTREDDTELAVSFHTDYDYQSNRFSSVHRYYPAYVNTEEDIAILLPLSTDHPPARTVLSQDGWWVGREVVVVGHPYGLVWSIDTGVVSSSMRTDVDGFRWMQISAPVSPGNSGGPVFNRYGEVLGIVSFRAMEPHLGGAVPLEVIQEHIGVEND